jgi:hypothetical protein
MKLQPGAPQVALPQVIFFWPAKFQSEAKTEAKLEAKEEEALEAKLEELKVEKRRVSSYFIFICD